jgi:chromosome segregation ATPase
MSETETGSYRWHDKEDYYRNELGPKIDRLQTLLQQYKSICQYEESLKQYGESLEQRKEVEEDNKRLRHLLESYNRVRTQTEEPPIDLGNGKFLVTIAEDPMAW